MHTVLIVDDIRLVHIMLGAELEDRGFRVLHAETIDQALAIATTEPDISLAVLDYRIESGQTGADLAKRLLALPGWSGIPLIGHSGETGEPKQAFAEAGVTHFCPKSAGFVNVAELIEKLLSVSPSSQ